ncbi:MAG: hypothetical protein WBD20_26870 [Pirellulaceae bacterium]
MRDQNDGNSAIAQAYVREMLEMNPMWESSAILKRRRELWGIDVQSSPTATVSSTASAGPSSSTHVEEQADRRREERARRSLETLQTQFFQLPAEKLSQHLQFLTHDRLPEFAAVAKRLKMVAQHRNTLLKINHEIDDSKFTYSLLHGLVSPAAKAGSLREQYIESIIAERRVKPSCEMIRTLVQQYPEIYELERDWLNLFLDKANQKQWIAQYAVRGRRGPIAGKKNGLGLVGFAMLVAAIIIVPLIASPEKKRKDSFRRGRPAPSYQPPVDLSNKTFTELGMENLNSAGIDPAEQHQPGATSFQMPDEFSTGPTQAMPMGPGLSIPSHEELMRQIRERPNPALQPSIIEQLDQMKSKFDQPPTMPWEASRPNLQPSLPQSLRSRLPDTRLPSSRLPSFEPPTLVPPSFTPGSFP